MVANRTRRLLLRAGAAFLVLASARPGAQTGADPASQRIGAFHDALLAAMKQADKLGVRGRFDRLAPTIRSTFDLAAMTRIAIGPEWTAIAAEKQRALIDNFSELTIANYASRFDGYSGERFEIDPIAEVRSSGRVVHTRLVPGSGEAVILDYLMRGSGDEWRVVDVYLTGTISELATKRAEFAAILKAGGPDRLISTLAQQTQKLMSAPSSRR